MKTSSEPEQIARPGANQPGPQLNAGRLMLIETCSPLSADRHQGLARPRNDMFVRAGALDDLTGFKDEAFHRPENLPHPILVNLETAAARILDGDASCKFHWLRSPTIRAIRRRAVS